MPTSDRELQFAAEFKLSITRALAHQLMVSLNELTPAGLTDTHLEWLEQRGGVFSMSPTSRSRTGVQPVKLAGELGDYLPEPLFVGHRHRLRLQGGQDVGGEGVGAARSAPQVAAGCASWRRRAPQSGR